MAGVETFSRTLGTGQDVLLIHGVGVSGRYWEPAQRELAATGVFRVHTVDLPGFGRSETPRWALTIERLWAHLESWIEASLPGEVSLIGQSLGCELAVLGACRLADRVPRLVLAAPNGLPEQRSVLPQLAWAALDAPRETLALFGAILPDYFRCGPVRILKLLARQRDFHGGDLLPHLSQPVLLMRGERDTVVSQRRLERTAERLRRPVIRTIPGAHAAHFTHATQFAEAVAPFLKEPLYGSGSSSFGSSFKLERSER